MIEHHDRGLIDLDELGELLDLARSDVGPSVGQPAVLRDDAKHIRAGGLDQ